MHFMHHLGAMHLRGDFARSDLRCDLLGQHSGNSNAITSRSRAVNVW